MIYYNAISSERTTRTYTDNHASKLVAFKLSKYAMIRISIGIYRM